MIWIIGMALLCDVLLYLTAPWILVAMLLTGAIAAIAAGWWLHTWSERNAERIAQLVTESENTP